MTENDARYFAGIVDGEGWIDCRRRLKKCSNGNFYKCSSIHVEIQMNHKGVMEWLNEKAGYLPILQLHDELCFNVNKFSMKDVKEIKKIMENCIEFKLPFVVDVNTGPSWGEAK